MTDNTPNKRFKILVCIDLSEESYRGLKYAVRIGSGNDADITLLYVRRVDRTGRTGGMQMRVARENMMEWGIELPGTRALKKARDMLVEMGFMEEDWRSKTIHKDIKGDPLGDNWIEYASPDGRTITLEMMVSPSVERGILDACEDGDYDMTIISASDRKDDDDEDIITASMAQTVATEHRGTVIVAKELEEAHGHMICVENTDISVEAAKKDAMIAGRCFCPIHLYSVARDDSEVPEAEEAIRRAKEAIEELGVKVFGTKIEIGDPVENIVREGRNFSLIVMSASEKVGFRRFFATSTAHEVLEHAHNSVMIVR